MTYRSLHIAEECAKGGLQVDDDGLAVARKNALRRYLDALI